MALGRVEELFGQLLASTRGAARAGSGASGSACPGPVEFGTGRPISPPIMPGWDGYPVRERLSARYDAPVWVDNDVNVLALGEWRSGVAAGHDNVVVVKVGTGHRRRDHRRRAAASRRAGLAPATSATSRSSDDRDVVCRCGNVGCLEALAGGAAIARDGETAAREGRSLRLREALDRRGAVTAEDVARAASFGDPVAVELLGEAGRRIGSMLASVVNFFNPSLVVIGGGVAQSGDVLLASIREAVYGRSLPLATRDLPDPSLVAGRPGGRDRGVVDGRGPAVRARVARALGRRGRSVRHARGRPGLGGLRLTRWR